MTDGLVTVGKDAWVGSGLPNATHFSPTRLRLKTSEVRSYVHLRSPIPAGDIAVTGKLRVKVAVAATGTFTFTARRAQNRVNFSEVTWNNQPGVTGPSATVTVTNPTAGQVLEFDVLSHLSSIAGGDPNYGWRISSDSTTLLKLSGFDSGDGPVLYAEWASRPATPTDVSPSGIVSLSKWVVNFTAPDVTGDDELDAIQVQLATASVPVADSSGTWTSPAYDTGTVSATVPEVDLARTDLPGGVYAGLADGATIYQHVRWRNTAGVWSKWSDTIGVTRAAKGALTITNPPSSPAVVLEPTPPYIATFTGTAKAFRMRVVLSADPSEEIVDSGWRQATDPGTVSWTHPERHRLQDDTGYRLIVDVRDNVDRVASPGDRRFIRATRDFTVSEQAGVLEPTAISVTTGDELPLAVVNFTRASAPDSFVIKRDGETVASNVDPADVVVSGTTYAWIDPDAEPYRYHDYQVRAVVNGARSVLSNTVTGAAQPEGLWLISRDRQEWVMLAGTGIDDWANQDQVGVFAVHGRSELVQIRSALGALGGSFVGEMEALPTKGLHQQRRDLRSMRKADKPVTLVAADYSARVRLRNVTDAPSPDSIPERIVRRVSFEFIESED